jgi:hypothetical protein
LKTALKCYWKMEKGGGTGKLAMHAHKKHKNKRKG